MNQNSNNRSLHAHHLFRLSPRSKTLRALTPRLQSAACSRFSMTERLMGVTMDYIHGTDEVFRLGKDARLQLFSGGKSSFSTIAATGPLPARVSMGEARKRYYLECRKLFS